MKQYASFWANLDLKARIRRRPRDGVIVVMGSLLEAARFLAVRSSRKEPFLAPNFVKSKLRMRTWRS